MAGAWGVLCEFVADFLQLVQFSVKGACHSTAKKFGWYVGRLFQQKEHTISIQ
jgi:hypothetical protein